MNSNFFLVFTFLAMLATQGLCKPLPDSAGRVPQPEGLAYGGIPYGSVSGQLSSYFGEYEPISIPNKILESDVQII